MIKLKWSEFNKTKKILLSLVVIIILIFIVLIIAAGNDYNGEQELTNLNLPSEFNGDKRISKSSSNSPSALRVDSDKGILKVEPGTDLPENVSKLSDDPYYRTIYGVYEIVEINGKTYTVSITNTQRSQNSTFYAYCVDNLNEFNKLNNDIQKEK